jgi:hypothetical protein
MTDFGRQFVRLLNEAEKLQVELNKETKSDQPRR